MDKDGLPSDSDSASRIFHRAKKLEGQDPDLIEFKSGLDTQIVISPDGFCFERFRPF